MHYRLALDRVKNGENRLSRSRATRQLQCELDLSLAVLAGATRRCDVWYNCGQLLRITPPTCNWLLCDVRRRTRQTVVSRSISTLYKLAVENSFRTEVENFRWVRRVIETAGSETAWSLLRRHVEVVVYSSALVWYVVRAVDRQHSSLNVAWMPWTWWMLEFRTWRLEWLLQHSSIK